jgi:hypothetical protein
LMEETGVPGVIRLHIIILSLIHCMSMREIFFIYFTHDLNRYTLNKKYKNTNKETK